MGATIQDYAVRAFTRLPSPLAKKPAPVSPWTKTPPAGHGRLRRHIEATYGIKVSWPTEIDKGVFLVPRTKGPNWIVRCFPPARPMDCVEGDAEVLRFLEHHGFPAERCAHEDPVTEFEKHGILVTEYVESLPTTLTLPDIMRALGDLVGRMHALPDSGGAVSRKAGGWHHLSVTGGGRDDDRDMLLPMLTEARDASAAERRPAYDAIIHGVEAIDPCLDLPHAFTNIDMGGPNVLWSANGPVTIDWTSAGRGPRVLSLTSLLAGSQDPSCIDAFIDAYRRHVELELVELDRLAAALSLHQLVLGAWMSIFVPDQAQQIANGLPGLHKSCMSVAARTRQAFKQRPSPPR